MGNHWWRFLRVIVGVGLIASAPAQTQLPPELFHYLQKRYNTLNKKKVTLNVSINEEYSEDFLKEMTEALTQYQKDVSVIPVPADKAVRMPPVRSWSRTTRWIVYRDDGMIKIDYNFFPLNFSTGVLNSHRGTLYSADGYGLYISSFEPSEPALGTTNIAYLVRYTDNACYFLSPETRSGRNLQPPDFVFLCGMDPLMMFWAQRDGWVIVQDDAHFLVVEKRGETPCLPPENPLRIRLWLDKKHDYAPYRVEKYTDDPRVLANYRLVAREVWQAHGYKKLGDTYIISEAEFIYYIKGHLEGNRLVYGGKVQKKYSIVSIEPLKKNLSLDLPDYIAIADFSLLGENPVFLDRAVTYKWRDYKRFLTKQELEKKFKEQFPELVIQPRNRLSFVTYLIPISLIVMGVIWLIRNRRVVAR